MTTLGWILLLFGVICARFAINGRGVTTMVGDVGDIVTGAITGDYDLVSEALARRGDAYEATPLSDPVPSAGGGGGAVDGGPSVGGVLPEGGIGPVPTGTGKGIAVLAAMKARAAKATGYTLGSTGPTRYDCSGLLWRAMQDTGVYTGARFTTHNWESIAKSIGAVQVSDPQPGYVVWFPGHIGVVENSTTYFSALNPKKGILSNPIRYTVASSGAAKYWRLP